MGRSSLPSPHQSPSQPAVDVPPLVASWDCGVSETHPAQKYVQRQQPLQAQSGVSLGHWGSEQLPSAQKVLFLPHEKFRPQVQLRGPGFSPPPHTCIQLVSETWPMEVARASVTTLPSPSPGLPTPAFSSLFSCPRPICRSPSLPPGPSSKPAQAPPRHRLSVPLQRSMVAHTVGDTAWVCTALAVRTRRDQLS